MRNVREIYFDSYQSMRASYKTYLYKDLIWSKENIDAWTKKAPIYEKIMIMRAEENSSETV